MIEIIVTGDGKVIHSEYAYRRGLEARFMQLRPFARRNSKELWEIFIVRKSVANGWIKNIKFEIE